MYRRQQMPFNWVMPQGPMGQYQRSPYHPMVNRQMNQQMRQMRPVQGKQGGGLLARILGKNKPTMGGFPGMYPAARGAASTGGSLLKSFTDPTAISGFLNNTQQILKAAQQISPIVSQYGPLVRNLPAMWKLYRGLKDAPEATEVDQQESPDLSMIDSEISTENIDRENSGKRSRVTSKSISQHAKNSGADGRKDEWEEESENELGTESAKKSSNNHRNERRSFPRMYI